MLVQPGLLYLTRSGWGANKTIPRLGYTVSRSQRTKAIIHHTVVVDNDATKNLWTSLDEVKSKMRQLQVIRPDLGMDVPYNFVMFLMEDGSIIVCEGRGLDRTGAHTHGHNTDGMATALQGNFMLPVDLSAYISGMSRWWGWLRYDQGMVNLGSEHPGAIAYGHRDFRDPNDTSTWTSCPGDNLYNIIPQLVFKEDIVLSPEFKEFIREQTKHLETRQNQIHAVDEAAHLKLKAQIDNLQVGGGEVDVPALAKAVVDELALRMKD